jgi:hypothetical protein
MILELERTSAENNSPNNIYMYSNRHLKQERYL